MLPLLKICFNNVHLSVRKICLVLIFLNVTGDAFAALGSVLSGPVLSVPVPSGSVLSGSVLPRSVLPGPVLTIPKLTSLDPLKPIEDVIEFLEMASPFCVLAKGVCPRNLVKFWLYTRDNRNNPEQVDLSRPSKAHWNPDCDFKIIIHGYKGNKDSDCVKILVSAYLNDECRCHNVVVLDWGPLCHAGCYFVAIQNLHSVAMCVRDLVEAVRDAGVLTSSCPHVIGHSLGAHIASYSSLYTRLLCRVTALDPAGPLFSPDGTVMPLARARDVYHTNIGLLGQRVRSGKVDVYFNNGAYQPGCGCDIGCSHSIICRYFAESINCCKPILALRSDGWRRSLGGDLLVPDFSQPLVALGECMDPTLSGDFLVLTNKNSPFLPTADFYYFTADDEVRRSRYQRAVDANNECIVAPVINPTFGLINKS